MTYIILKQPHPLDAIWEQAVEAVDDAQHAIDGERSDLSDEEGDRLSKIWMNAVIVLMALPARNLSDSLFKLNLSGLADMGNLNFVDQRAIFDEATSVLEADMARGDKLLRVMPDLLEGVTL